MSVIMIVSTLAAGLRSDKACLRVSCVSSGPARSDYGVRVARYPAAAQHR